MYRVHQGATLIPTVLAAPAYKLDNSTVSSIHASASRSKDGTVNVSLVNLNPNAGIEVATTINGAGIRSVEGEVLASSRMNAMNSVEAPDAIKPVRFSDFRLRGSDLTITVPAKSVVILALRP